MSQIQIIGGNCLHGQLRINGAKNSLLPIMTACLMVQGTIYLHDVPKLSDLNQMLHILADLGCTVNIKGNTVKIEVNKLNTHIINDQVAPKIRGSIFVMGALLSRLGKVVLPFPGGCAIGSRPIDLHLTLLKQIGVKCHCRDNKIFATYQPRHHHEPTILSLDFPSVGATENIIQATALGIPGNTYIIHGAAKEPEIVDLCNFLNQCGAQIHDAGTDTITIHSVAKLHGTTYAPIPDRINTGSYLIAVAVTGGDVTLTNTISEHHINLINKLKAVGARITVDKDTIHIIMSRRRAQNFNIHTAPYPGFPTDLQSQFCVLTALTKGHSTITENLFENRFRYVPELVKLGAQIIIEHNQAQIKGVSTLTATPTHNLCPSSYQIPKPQTCLGTTVTAHDLRGGVALVIAALAAHGTTTINHAEYIYRGHQDIVKDLRQLGANIVALD